MVQQGKFQAALSVICQSSDIIRSKPVQVASSICVELAILDVRCVLFFFRCRFFYALQIKNENFASIRILKFLPIVRMRKKILSLE